MSCAKENPTGVNRCNLVFTPAVFSAIPSRSSALKPEIGFSKTFGSVESVRNCKPYKEVAYGIKKEMPLK